MRVLGIGEAVDLGDLYLRLQRAGHEVRVHADDASSEVLRGLLPRTAAWRGELGWVGKDGLIIFEQAEHGQEQDELRRQGFQVIGCGALGERLENDRAFGQAALKSAGLQTAPVHSFRDFDRAIGFLHENPGRTVFKLNGSFASTRNYVGELSDGSDMRAFLELQRGQWRFSEAPDFVLMEHLEGVEMGTGAYFDGEQFLSPACLDWEHKRFFPGDLGELTGEMGTLVTYENSAKFFATTLGKLSPLLHEGGYQGYINLNTMVNERGVFPLELTCRFGYPGFAIQAELHQTPWDALLSSLVGQRLGPRSFATHSGYAVGVVLTVPPFPYQQATVPARGQRLLFRSPLSDEEASRLHLGEMMAGPDGSLQTSGPCGYALVVTGSGRTVEAAQAAVLSLTRKLHLPNLRYRSDIGDRFLERDRALLERLGWL